MVKLRRSCAKYPICSEVIKWENLDEALSYFSDQGLTNIDVLHNNEIESCIELIAKLKISKEEFVDHIQSGLSKNCIDIRGQS